MMDASGMVTSKTVGRGVFWSYLTFVLGKVMVFASTVILARLLTPGEFGLAGLASVIAGYLGTLHTFGVGEAFIQNKFGSKQAANATFVLSTASGILLFLLAVMLTPAVVLFFREPQLNVIFPAMASTYIITGLTTIHDALLVRELRFQTRLVPTLAQSLAKGISSIALAFLGYGVWAIVWGVIIGNLAKALALLWVSPWKPTRDWDSKTTREIFGFGKFMVLQNILGALEDNVDYLIIGRRLGTEKLGFYTLGFRAPELAIVSLPAVISNVAYPAYAKIQEDREALRRSVYKTVQLVSWVAIPAGIGLAMASSAFILTFYTEKWADVIPVMQILSLYAMVYTLTYNFGDIYKAIGRPDILNKLSLSTIAFTVLILLFASRYGIVAVAWAHFARVVLIGVAQIFLVNKMLDVKPWPILQSIAKSLAAAACMGLVMYVVPGFMPGIQQGYLLASQLAAGAVFYIAASFLLNRGATLSVLNLAMQLTGGRSAGDWISA